MMAEVYSRSLSLSSILSWYLEGIQFVEDEKKNGSISYLRKVWVWATSIERCTYFVPNICITSLVIFLTKRARTRIFPSLCKHNYFINRHRKEDSLDDPVNPKTQSRWVYPLWSPVLSRVRRMCRRATRPL